MTQARSVAKIADLTQWTWSYKVCKNTVDLVHSWFVIRSSSVVYKNKVYKVSYKAEDLVRLSFYATACGCNASGNRKIIPQFCAPPDPSSLRRKASRSGAQCCLKHSSDTPMARPSITCWQGLSQKANLSRWTQLYKVCRNTVDLVHP